MTPNPVGLFDRNGLADLKLRARQDENQALRDAARQFEALFLDMMMRSMREAGLGEGIADSEQVRGYQGLLDSQLSVSMAGRGGLGVADLMVGQLRGEPPTDPGQHLSPPPRTESRQPETKLESDPTQARPEAFVRQFWPLARRYGEQLGVSPQALLAQAALESGWGGRTIRRPDGSNSHNLFGIKAQPDWAGPTAKVATLEYGPERIPMRQIASFRAYPSYEAAFADYVEFLRTNPRYRTALDAAADPARFVHGLQAAGYATDPQYANKILDIMTGEHLAGVSSPMQVAERFAPTDAAG